MPISPSGFSCFGVIDGTIVIDKSVLKVFGVVIYLLRTRIAHSARRYLSILH